MESKMIRQVDDLGRVAIPKTIREELNILMGDKLKITKTDNGVTLEKCLPSDEDIIFLLSDEEYGYYKDKIPHCKTFWWLRTPGNGSDYASYVFDSGSVNYYGDYVFSDNIGVRPALKSEIFKKVGETLVVNNFPFTCIDEGLGIATVPITFDKFDNESNDYEESLIRKRLLDWAEKLVWNKQYVPETI